MTELDSFAVYERIAAALEAGTSLRQMPDDLIGGRVESTKILHQHFRIDPRSIEFPKSRARPGDVVIVKETVAVLIHHDIYPDASRASYALAAQDFTAALRALLTRTELSGLGQPVAAARRVKRSAQSIEQEFVLAVEYHVTLPEASGPE